MTHRAAQALSVVLIALVVFGAVLRIASYIGNPSLWLDEAALAHNIIGRSFAGLLAPLDRQQVAPLGFLWLEKGAVSLFGTSEYALRLVPLLASIASLPLFALVARRLLRPIAAIFALALFATATPLFYFAAEMKQYALDVAVVLGLFALAVGRVEYQGEPAVPGAWPRGRRATRLAIAGIVAPWLSQPSVFALGGVALYLAIPFVRARTAAERRTAARPLLPVFALWALSGGASIIHSFVSVPPDTRARLTQFWERGFIPVASGFMASVHWFGGTTHDVFAWLFPPVVATVAIGLFVLGIAALVRRSDGSASLLLAPLAFMLLASALRLYPVSYRLLLFTTPSLLLAVGAGAEWLLSIARALGTRRARATGESRQEVGRASWPASAAAYAICAVLALLVARSAMTFVEIPFYREEIRPVVKYLAQHREPDDVVYVYYASAPAFQYYAQRDGIPRSAYRLGSCSRNDWRQYLHEVDALRGRPRVWFVMSHPFAKAGIREDSLFLQYFSALGRRIDSTSAIGAQLALYDLSAARTSAAQASFVPPASGDSSSADLGCSGAVSAGS
ncbi:MAG TPA: glycosyltransferase family 39 protein [Gemmatimonadaceae bacterium]|nr:glycosyltransferase family 39 protein [Gemmatimonadaceae bacterium]